MGGVGFSNNNVVTQQQQQNQQVKKSLDQQNQQTQEIDATKGAASAKGATSNGPLSSANALLDKAEEKDNVKSGGAPLTINALADVGPQLFASFKNLITGNQTQETNQENAKLPTGAATEIAAPVKKEVVNPVAQTISQTTGTNLNVKDNPANDPNSAEGADKTKKDANVTNTVQNNQQSTNVQAVTH